MRDVLPGVYLIYASNSFSESGSATVRVLPGRSATANITVALSSAEGLIKGRIVDASNRPIVGVIIKTVPATGATETDSTGMFYIPRVKEGEYIIETQSGEYPRHTKFVEVTSGRVTYLEFVMSSIDPLTFDALIAHYPFDGNGDDFSIIRNDLTVKNPTYVPSRFADESLNALQANGTTTKAWAHHRDVYNSPSISVSMWLKLPPITTTQDIYILSHYALASSNGFAFLFVGGDIQWIFGDGAHTTHCRNSNEGITDNEWHSIIATASATGSAMYFDGEKVASGTGSVTGIIRQLCPLEIASISPTGNASAKPFAGAIDDVRIYSKVLSEKEIELLATEK